MPTRIRAWNKILGSGSPRGRGGFLLDDCDIGGEKTMRGDSADAQNRGVIGLPERLCRETPAGK